MKPIVTVLLLAPLVALCAEAPRPGKVPLIDVTDLYHPPPDPGDNFDLLAAYTLPGVDLRAATLDTTGGFRKAVADVPGMHPDNTGPRADRIGPLLRPHARSLAGRATQWQRP